MRTPPSSRAFVALAAPVAMAIPASPQTLLIYVTNVDKEARRVVQRSGLAHAHRRQERENS